MAAAPILAAALAGSWALPPPSADPLGDVQRAARLRSVEQASSALAPQRGCVRTGDEEILVCGRPAVDIRIEPSPPRGLGEIRSGMAAMNAGGCLGDCRGFVGITVDPIRLIRDPVGALRDALRIRR